MNAPFVLDRKQNYNVKKVLAFKCGQDIVLSASALIISVPFVAVIALLIYIGKTVSKLIWLYLTSIRYMG